MANASENKSAETAETPAADRYEAILEKSREVSRGSEELDAKWKAFQAQFDKMTSLLVDNMKRQLQGYAPGDLRSAALVPPETIAQVLRRSKKVVLLTGAGISAESGIPTFRGSDGFWTIGSENYRPQEMATFEMFNKHPEELWKWYHMRWSICRNAKPNPGHTAVAELEKLITSQQGSTFDLITQNIDGLHLDAGSKLKNTYQVHGSMNFMRCDESVEGSCCHGLSHLSEDPDMLKQLRAGVQPWGKEWTEEEVMADPIPRCKTCGTRCRPHVLWFDECYNEAWYSRVSALNAADAADCLVVVGTTLTTGLPSTVVGKARQRGIPIINLDPSAAEEPREGMLNCAAKSGEALPKVATCLKRLFQEPNLAPLRRFGETQPKEAAPQLAIGKKPSLKAAASGSGLKAAVSLAKAKAKAKAPAKAVSVAKAAAPKAAPKPKAGLLEPLPPVTAEPRKLFVYGSLRPDDNSGASWTKSFTEGLAAAPAQLRGASLYQEDYAVVALEETAMAVRGMVLTVPEAAWAEKLAEADRIEGYPDLYDRAIVEVEILSPSGQILGTELAWVYHRTGTFERNVAKRIPDGDWLSRPREASAE